jgi:C4-dicarboxylate transporter DctQ subunit
VTAPRRALPLRVLDHLEEWLIAGLMAGATLLIFVAVLHRYAAGLAIPWLQDRLLALNLGWAQELCIYMFVWMAKFGAAYGVRTGIHVGVDVLVNRLAAPLRSKLILFGLFAGALFTGVIGCFGANFVWGLAGTDQSTPDLELPSWIVYLAIPCGSFLMCFRFLEVALGFWRTGELPHHDHAHVEGIEGDAAAEAIDAGAMPQALTPRDLATPKKDQP